MHKTKMKGLAKRVLSFSLAAIMTLSSGVSSAATVYASEPGQTPAPIATEYAIAVEQPEHGTITMEPSDMAEAGTSVQATVAPNQGYEVTEFLVTADAGDTVEVSESAENQYSFTMPESNVTVTATLEQTEEGGEGGEEPPVVTEYTITSELSEHILLDAPEKYPGGYEVQVGFTLDEGYGLKELSIETESGTEVEYTNENLIYSFVMPEENVVIKATAEKYAEMNVEFALPEGVTAELDQTHYFVGDTATITIENNSGRAIESVSVGKGQETLEVTKVNDTTYTFIVPDEDVDILITLVANTIQVTNEENEYIEFTYDHEDGVYEEGETVTVTLTPDEGYTVVPDSISIKDGNRFDVDYEIEIGEDGVATITFIAPATDVILSAEAKEVRHITLKYTDVDGNVPDNPNLNGTITPEILYEGIEVTINVTNSGSYPWKAVVVGTESGSEYEYDLYSDRITFTMPDEDLEVELYEVESSFDGSDLDDSSTIITGDVDEETAALGSGQEPTVKIGKSAVWTDIENGYAELTLTETDTSKKTNVPTDYIIILDKTRTMSLNEATWGVYDAAGMNRANTATSAGHQKTNSPCYNPDHVYFVNGQQVIYADYENAWVVRGGQVGEWIDPPSQHWNYHFNLRTGYAIEPLYRNGCTDRLSIAKDVINDFVDDVAEANSGLDSSATKSRIAYWGFGDWYGHIQDDTIQYGLYHFTDFTSDYSYVKSKVTNTGTLAGTYYLPSFEKALEMVQAKRNSGNTTKTKIIFISDGMESESEISMYGDNTGSRSDTQRVASQIKAIPNTTIYTLGIGIPDSSEAASILRSLSSGSNYSQVYWTELAKRQLPEALSTTFDLISNPDIVVSATNKVFTDYISQYWELVECNSATGGVNNVSINKSTGQITWNIPTGADTTYTATFKLKLKDEYRYLLSDTQYPTNADVESGKGPAKITYSIQNGPYNGQSRSGTVATPNLKYGTVNFEGEKNWTVDGSNASEITLRLTRIMAAQDGSYNEANRQTINSVTTYITSKPTPWHYEFTVRQLPDGTVIEGETQKPLIKYDNAGNEVKYEVQEVEPDNYVQLTPITTTGSANSNGGSVVDTQFYNEPLKIKVQLTKVDEETNNPLSGAVFTVYQWSKSEGEYVEYKGTTNSASKPYETGDMDGLSEAMTLEEGTKGVYTSPAYLYYTPDNEGKFRIIETTAPEGYFGDYVDNNAENAKNVYDVNILDEVTAETTGKTVIISNNTEQTFDNQRVLGSITYTKNDEEGKVPTAQGDATLVGATYRLYAAEDIVHQDQSGTVLYEAGEEIHVKFVENVDGVNYYVYQDKDEYETSDAMVTGEAIDIVIDELEIGSYYLKEESASEGYLVDPDTYEFEITYQGEDIDIVEVPDDGTTYPVYERVMKQALEFYKVGGNDRDTQIDPMPGAKFSVYLVSDLANGKYVDVSNEDLPQAILDDYRNPTTLTYEAFEDETPAVVYAEADDADVTSGRLVKEFTYASGKTVSIEDTDEVSENAYLVAELEVDEKGIVQTPSLPYGRYIVIETTVPEGYQAAKPFVIDVKADDNDGTVDGDGQGSQIEDIIIPMDKEVMSYIRIVKTDSQSGNAVLKEGASYVIHDVDGSWFEYWSTDRTTAEMNAYKEQFGDLVVQYSQGEYIGTEENPYTTKLVSTADDETQNVYIETIDALPAGTYELEEISAPDGYVLNGYEGVIAKDESITTGNHTFYETKETGEWEDASQGPTRFVVSSTEAAYDTTVGAYVITVKQQNDPAIGKIAVYAEGEVLMTAEQTGTTILDRLQDRLESFFGSILGIFGLDTPNEDNLTEEELSEYQDYEFGYEMKPIEGAQFEIRAAEDIYSQEGGANATLLYHEGDLVVTLTTDENGQTWTGQEDWEGTDIAKGLPLGKYTVTQTVAGYGFALSEENAEPREIEIEYAGQTVPVIYRDTSYTNPRQKVNIEVTKRDVETDTLLSGATFGLYAAEDIVNYNGKVVVKEGTLVAIASTYVDEDGNVANAKFEPDLPLAKYYIKEIRSPYGYTTNKDKIEVDATYKTDQREVIEVNETVKNQQTKVQINLMDYYTDVELDGAQLTVLDEDGNSFTTILSVHENNVIIRGLEINKEYTVKELVAPEGYHYKLYIKDDYVTTKDGVELDKEYVEAEPTDEIKFTVQDINDLQVVSIFNKPILGELTVEKTGQVATGTETTTDENGNTVTTPVYEIQGLPGAEYVLVAKETIDYPDGYSGTLFEAGDIVLDTYAEQKEDGLLGLYTMEIVDGIGELTDVSEYIGVKYDADATDEEIQAFYAEHGENVERQIPSEEEIESGETTFSGTPVNYVLRTNEDGLVRITGLPLGEYQIVEVKAPEGYYRDKAECIQDVSIQIPDDISGRPEDIVKVEVGYENEKQEVPPYEEPDKTPEIVIYHPDILITKNADKEVYDPGETVTYRIVVTNTGDVDLQNVTVEDSLAGGIIQTIDYLAVNEQYAFDYEYVVPKDAEPGSRIDNRVDTIGTPVIPDPGVDENGDPILVDPSSYVEPTDSDIEKVFVRGQDIVVKKVADKRMYKPGETATYTIEVINPNDYDLVNVEVKDTLNGVFTLLTDQNGIRVTEDGIVEIDVLPANGKINLVYKYDIPEDAEAGEIENIVIATGTSTDPTPNKPDIQIVKYAEKHIYRAGETVVYTMIVTNTGDVDLENVVVEDNLGGTWVDNPEIGDLAVGESVELTYEYVVPAGTDNGTEIPNTAVVTGDTKEDPENPDEPKETVKDTDDEEVIVVDENQPAIKLTKTVDKKVVKPGETVTYTLVITNTGNVDLKDVVVTDDNVDLGEAGNIGNLAIGESKEITYTYTVAEDAEEGTVIPNVAVVTGTEDITPDPDDPTIPDEPRQVTDEDDEEIEVVTEDTPAITVTKVADKHLYKPGETAEYLITVTNTGNVDLVNVTVEDQMEVEGGTWIDSPEIGNLAVGESVELRYQYVIPDGAENGTVDNIVIATGEDPNEEPTEAPSIKLTKTVDKKIVNPGDTVTYTLTIENNGNVDLTDVTLSDTNVDLTDYEGIDLSVIGDLAVGEVKTISYDYVVPENTEHNTQIPNTAVVTGKEDLPEGSPEEPEEVTDEDDEEIIVVDENQPAISIIKTVDKKVVRPGETVTYKLIVTNTGAVDLKDVVVTDDNVDLGEAGNIGSLAVGESKEITYTYTIAEDAEEGTVIPNVAAVTGTEDVPEDPDNPPKEVTDEDDEEIEVVTEDTPAISVIKTTDKHYYKPGETATYQIVVTNTGNIDLTNVTVEDQMEVEGGTWVDDPVIGELAVGESVTLEYEYTIPEGTKDGTEINNVVIATGENPEDKPEDHPSIKIEKAVSKKIVKPGDTVTYTLKVTNNGNVDLTDVVVTDDHVDLGEDGNIGALAVGETKEIKYTFTVPEDTEDGTEIPNVAVVTGKEETDPDDPNPPEEVTDEDDEEIIVTTEQTPAITITKTVDKYLHHAGDTAVYEIVVKNTGDTALTNVVVEDSLDGAWIDNPAIGNLAVGESVTLRYEYVIPAETVEGTEIPNTATVTGTEVLPDGSTEEPRTVTDEDDEKVIIERDNTVTDDDDEDIEVINPNVPSIKITKTVDKYMHKAGETAVYSLVVTNDGNVDLTNVVVEDSLENGTWVDSPEIGDLAVGESVTLRYEYVIPEDAVEGVEIPNTATVTGTEVLPEGSTEEPRTVTDEDDEKIITEKDTTVEDDDDEEIEIINPDAPHISITKDADHYEYRPGETVVYTITVHNDGNIDLKDVVVEDNLGGTWIDSPEIGDLAVGERVSLRYEYTIADDTEDGTTIPNTATVTGTEDLPEGSTEEPREVTDEDDEEVIVQIGEPVEDDDDEIIVVQDPEITITKNVDKKIYQPGETAHYTIDVTNTGDCDLVDVVVYEELLTDGVFVSTTKGTFDGIQAEIGDLAVGEVVTLEFEYVVPEDAEAGTTIYNVVSTVGTSKPVVDPVIPENPDGTPNYLPTETVTDTDEEEIYVKEFNAGLSVSKYSIDEGVRTEQAGAEFTLYAKEDVTNIFGTVIYAAGTEIQTAITGEDGIAYFTVDVPIGIYSVKETKAPDGHYSSDKEITFDLTQWKNDDSVHYISLHDFIENPITVVNIKLIDDMTRNELADAMLQVVDEDGNVVNAWITKTEDGYTIKGLNPDETYTIVETVPRDGYLLEFTGATIDSENAEIGTPSGNKVTFTLHDVVTGTTETGKIDKDTIPEETRIVVENPFVVGNVRLNKDGEKLDSWNLVDKLVAFVKSIFNFSRQPLEGVEFTIYAKEDIVHPDGVTGVVFHKGDVVATGVRGIESPAIGKTNNLGVVEFNGMYLGQYEIVETATVEGYNLDIEPRTITLAYVDGVTSPVNAEEGEINWTNERQTVRIEITKRDIEDAEKTIQGAVFGLYNKEDILNYKGEVIVEADTLLELSETDANGVAVFESDLPLGTYYVKETHNPDGYTSSNEVIEIDATYNPDVEVIEIKEDFFNEITRVNIEKYASDTNEPLVGATLAVYHGNDLIDTWVTDGTPHEIKGLITGETYTLKEIKPADGYTTAMDVTFVVEDRDLETGIYNTQVVTMTDDPTKVQIEKYASDTDKQLVGAKLAVYHGDELIESWTTDGTPHVITGLIVGETYTLKELEAPDGYNVASDVTFTVSDRNMETGEYVTQVVTMTDEKKPSESHGGSGGSSEPTDDKHIVPTGVDNNMVLLGVAAVVLVVIAIAFIVFATRKRKDNNTKDGE